MVSVLPNMFSAIKNAQMRSKPFVKMPYSNFLFKVAKALQEGGYLEEIKVIGKEPKRRLKLNLKYSSDDLHPAITSIKSISTSGRRRYVGYKDLKPSPHRLTIVSTSSGIMSDREAKKRRLGGEVLCEIE